jgi:hypothetical protein
VAPTCVLANVVRPSPRRDEYIEAALQQDEIRSVPRHIDGLFDRQAGVRDVHRRCVVDAISEEPDNVPYLLKSEDDAFLLVRIDFCEYVSSFRGMPQGFVNEFVLVAEVGNRLVGVGTYVRDSTQTERAEVGFAIADALQGRGVGTRMLEMLAVSRVITTSRCLTPMSWSTTIA